MRPSPRANLRRLNDCLERFRAKHVNAIEDQYSYYPSYVGSRVGSGSYGEVFRMKAADPNRVNEPVRVVKVIPKSRVSVSPHQTHHLCAELAVSGIIRHRYLNHRVDLLHNDTNIFIVLEMCEGLKPDLLTRVAHVFSLYQPRRIADIDSILEKWTHEHHHAAFEGESLGDFVDRTGKFDMILHECGAKKEIPYGTDLFNMICALRRIPDGMARIIARQALEALGALHENAVVHRDVKTENLVVGVVRKAALLRDDRGTITGVRITEDIHCRLIDFGLVKYMRIAQFPDVLSPGLFKQAAVPSPGIAAVPAADSAAEEGMGDRDGTDDFDDFAPPASKPVAPRARIPFPVSVTPCGTELYCSLEVINGILDSGLGQRKWSSDRKHLPLMDVYGVGTMLFCMTNGCPPFRPPRDQYRQVSREERIRQIQRLVQAGPTFKGGVAADTQEFTLLLMHNDIGSRPSVSVALTHPYVNASKSNTFSYEVMVDGRIAELTESAAATTDESSNDTALQDDIMAAIRDVEDDGDSHGKDVSDAVADAAAGLS